MSNQDTGRGPSPGSRGQGGVNKMGKAASDALSEASATAKEAAHKAARAASETRSTMTSEVRKLLDRQVGSGADRVSHFAAAAQRAADELDQSSPQLAELVRASADRIEGYAESLRGRSADELMRDAAEFTRRQPALVLGLSALVGFLALRTLKSTAPGGSDSPTPYEGAHEAGRFHGP